jgi:hypothetical protein
MDLDRAAGRQRGADAVGADDALAPVAAVGQVDVLRGVERAGVAGGLEHDAARVGQQHDRARLRQQVRRRQEDALRGPDQVAVAQPQLLDLVGAARRQRRHPRARLDAEAPAALPRGQHMLGHVGRHGRVAGHEALPGQRRLAHRLRLQAGIRRGQRPGMRRPRGGTARGHRCLLHGASAPKHIATSVRD